MRKNNGTLIDYSVGPGVYIYVAWDHDPIILRAGGEKKDEDDFPPEMDGFLPGIEDLTDRKEANKSICWRWEKPQWAQVQRKAKPVKKIEILLDELGQISERNAQQLANQWNALIAGGEEAEQKPLNSRARKQLQSGQLGAIVVQRKEKNDEAVMNGRANNANIIQKKPSSIVGMAFFHRQGYSKWQEKFPELDNIYVAESSRQQGIRTAIMAELTKIAEKMGATKVQWTAPEPSKQKCHQHVPFFESLNAANLTDIEERLLNQWNYEKSGMHSSAAAGGDKANSNGNGTQRKEC